MYSCIPNDTCYPHGGHADNAAYWHDGRVDKWHSRHEMNTRCTAQQIMIYFTFIRASLIYFSLCLIVCYNVKTYQKLLNASNAPKIQPDWDYFL